jgi:hypothetical protein
VLHAQLDPERKIGWAPVVLPISDNKRIENLAKWFDEHGSASSSSERSSLRHVQVPRRRRGRREKHSTHRHPQTLTFDEVAGFSKVCEAHADAITLVRYRLSFLTDGGLLCPSEHVPRRRLVHGNLVRCRRWLLLSARVSGRLTSHLKRPHACISMGASERECTWVLRYRAWVTDLTRWHTCIRAGASERECTWGAGGQACVKYLNR